MLHATKRILLHDALLWSKIAAVFFHFSSIQPAPKLWWRSQVSCQSVWARRAAYWRKYYPKEWTTAWLGLTMILRAICLNLWLFWKLCCRNATTPLLLASILFIQLQLCSGPAYVTCSTALIKFVMETYVVVFLAPVKIWLNEAHATCCIIS